jgi:universal stress protein E
MGNPNKLLVVLQDDENDQPALSRAVQLSQVSGASIVVLLVVYHLSYDLGSMLSMSDRESMRSIMVTNKKEWLEQLLIKYDCDIPIEAVVQWHSHTYEAVIEYAKTNTCDLIIKAARKNDSLTSLIVTPTDWHLIRKSPLPVLLVKEHDWPEGGRILACLNVAPDSPIYQDLNARLLFQSQVLAKLLNAHIHLVNGYPGTPVNIAIELPDFDVHAYNESIRQQHNQRVLGYASQFNIPDQHCHVIEGLAEDVIASCSRQIDAGLVVIGTTGRTGLSAALMGNTAEHVIDNLNCDLLVVKPDKSG